MTKTLSIKRIVFAILLFSSLLAGNAHAQRGSLMNGQSLKRNHYQPNISNHKKKVPSILPFIVPGPPVIVEDVIVPVEQVIVEHNDTIYAAVIYNPYPIKGHFTALGGVRLTKGDDFKPGFNAGIRGDWYRHQKNFAGYLSLGLKYEMSNYRMEQSPAYSHNSFFYFDLDLHYGPRFINSKGDVFAFGIGPVIGISPFGKTKNQDRSYSTFSGRDISNRVQSGIDFEVLYTRKHLFFSTAITKVATPYEFEIDAKGMGLNLSFNAGYRF